MANVMSMVGIKNHPSRNGFDLSRKNLFTAKVGEILPVAVIECLPGDKHVIKPKWMTRTQPLNTAAYTRIKEYFNWYFVPTNLLWNKFNDFITNMKDNNLKADSISSATKLTDQHPYVTLSQIWDYVQVLAIQEKVNFFGYSRAALTCKLLDYLGYGDFYDALIVSDDVIPFPSDRVNAVVNLFPLLAYQKIYQDHIRDSQWEKAYAPACNINYMTGTSLSLNIPLQDIDIDVENMFDLRYSNWNKDYFMGVLPNSQYGNVATVITDSPNVVRIHNRDHSIGSTDVTTNADGFVTAGTAASWELLNTQGNKYAYQLSILSLRQAEALQKMREVMQSHAQDYKSQVEARWNVSVNAAISDRCQWLGGDMSQIDINEVLNTNLDQSERIASIKGKGVGIGDGYVRCNTECHGYLICLYHAVPVLDFSISGVKKHNLKSLFTDYAQPELDKTGMVSVPFIELSNKNVPNSLLNSLLGYAPQYYEYKAAYDECHGAFNDHILPNPSLKGWVAPIDESYIRSYSNSVAALGTGEFMTYYFLKVPPFVLDPIFAIAADSLDTTDQLLVNSYFDIKSARNLDYNGLPY